jgi:hypothetical protein
MPVTAPVTASARLHRWTASRYPVLASTPATFTPFEKASHHSGRRTIRGSPPGNSLEPFRCYDLCGQIVPAKKGPKGCHVVLPRTLKKSESLTR